MPSSRICSICERPIEIEDNDCRSENTGMIAHRRCFVGMTHFIEEAYLVGNMLRRHFVTNAEAKRAAEAYERARERLHEAWGAMYNVSLDVQGHFAWSIKANLPPGAFFVDGPN